MLRFSAFAPATPQPTAKPAVTNASAKSTEAHPLDAMTGGAFSAATSGERAARVREWLAGNPSAEQMQEVFKELSGRDKGAAKPLREKLDELKRAKGQEAISAEWAGKATALLAMPKLNIADGIAWQRDAAKAGAALSREPLAALKVQLAERVKGVEDLQHRAQVQREAAVLLAHRIELLSTKSFRDAQAAWDALRADVAHWQAQADALAQDANWPSVDGKFPPLLDGSRAQLLVVWDAFQGALSAAVAAADDKAAPLPGVPVWADELRALRGVPLEPAQPKVDPAILKEKRERSAAAVREALQKLEQEVGEGHGKATPKAAAELRNQLKEHGKLIDHALENQAHAALAAAGELEGWQRWRADQLREELVGKAEGLLKLPEGQALGGRKMQDVLRTLRDQWKTTDQGGVPNHALWKRFDHACNEAYKVVEVWLEKVKAESAENKAQRLALIEEINAFTAACAARTEPHEWKAFSRALHALGDRWRDGGHVGEKLFAELQPLYKEAIKAAAAPLEAEQKASTARRQAMIEEATTLGAQPMMRIDAVRALQQRWQSEAQTVPLERKFEQKLWDAFRKPIDDAFNRKTAEREKAAADLGEHDKRVVEASKALDKASASGDAQAIRAAMAGLEAALRGQSVAQTAVDAAVKAESHAASAAPAAGDAPASAETGNLESNQPSASVESTSLATETVAEIAPAVEAEAPVAVVEPPKPTPKKVVAVRGDDRPGARKAESAPAAGRGGKFGDKGGDRGGKPGGPGGARAPAAGDNRFIDPRKAERFGDRPERGERGERGDRGADRFEDRGPRLGDAAFRAQRDALEHAQIALKKLAAQAHGELLTNLLSAWAERNAEHMPSAQDFGSGMSPAGRAAWAKAVADAPKADPKNPAATALLRVEMAAEVPTPAEHMSERRMLQLQLLTRRNDPPPAQTWAVDTTAVLSSTHDESSARRLQNALKVLLKR